MNGLLLSRVAMVGVVAAASSVVTNSVNGSSSATARADASSAWIDDPLDGTVLELGPVTIVAHAADPDGVTQVALTVDGAAADTVPASDDDLVTVEFEWMPPGAGTFDLQVTGTDSEGDETGPGLATVTVVGGPASRDGSTTTSTARDGSTSTTTSDEETTTTEPVTDTSDAPRVTTTSEPDRTTSSSTQAPRTTTTTAPPRTTSTTAPPRTTTTEPPRTTTTEPPRTTTTTEPPRTTTTTEPPRTTTTEARRS